MSDPLFSRSGRTDAGGKLTERFDVPVSAELNEAVIALAAVAGVPKAEYIRGLIERAIYGDFAMLRRLAGQVGRGPWDQSPVEEGRGGR